jgi:translation initiation factor eIF-2B subunit alpha
LSLLLYDHIAGTMYELVEALKDGAAALKKRTPNPISLTAGCDIFIRYVTTTMQEFDVGLRAIAEINC